MRLKGCVLLLLVAGPLRAQVIGYLPDKSPYLDLGPTQEWTLLVGEQFAHPDAAGVAPQSGLLTGLQYEWRAAGPFNIGLDLGQIESQRKVINAAAIDTANRDLGIEKLPLYFADFQIAMGLTGARSWHHLVPMITAGLGTITDFRGRDTSSFDFGTRFALTWGMGIRWVPGGHFQLRADATDRMYTIDYPESFYTAPSSAVPAFLTINTNKSRWENNPALTLGLSYFY
jgi:hypothetical protein